MGNNKFLKLCKETVLHYFNETYGKTLIKRLTEEDIYVVWCVKALQNNKALLSTTVDDGMYYELTYNGDKKELYIDAYEKKENVVKKIEGE